MTIIKADAQRLVYSPITDKDLAYLVRRHVQHASIRGRIRGYSMRADYWLLRNTRKVRRLVRISERSKR